MSGYEYIKNHRIKKRKQGLCRDCINPHLPNRVLCSDCTERNSKSTKARRRDKILAGVCPSCEIRQPEKGKITCNYCTLRSIGYKRKKFFSYRAVHFNGMYGTKLIGRILGSLWKKQKGFCALSGQKLTVLNAELDHIIPKTRGGGHIIENLRWLVKDVNRLKRNYLDNEFLSLCKQITEHTQKAPS